MFLFSLYIYSMKMMKKNLWLIIAWLLITWLLTACGTSWLSWGETSWFSWSVTTAISGLGTEPFWWFQFSGTDLIWTEPGEDEVIKTTYHQFDQSSTGNTITYTNGSIDITADFVSCSDGMSDRTYPLTVIVSKDGQTLSGCGRI